MKTFEIELSKKQIDEYNNLLALSFHHIKDEELKSYIQENHSIMLFSTDTEIKQMKYHIYIGLCRGFNHYWVEYNIVDGNGIEDFSLMNDNFMEGVEHIITLSNNEKIAIKVKQKN